MCQPRPDVCPDVVQPVCGCDGRTYGNSCEANQAGTDVASNGACPNPTVCTPGGSDCGSGQYCAVPDGSCSTPGVMGACSQRPGQCPLVYNPVCGCDGRTYGNSCEAAAAGINVNHAGQCLTTAACSSNLDCGDALFCDFDNAIAACGAGGAMGICRPRPQLCPDVVDPVCGCDGRTYGNACEAAAAGVDVASAGACTGARMCLQTALNCGSAQYCDYSPNSCGANGASGQCSQRPQTCPLLYRPVCGCDAATYGNACEAARAGVDVAQEGECATVARCGGLLGGQCQPEQFCDWEPNSCGAADQEGICRPRPQGCPDVYQPVCGCDGNTYGNSCEAAARGLDVASEGACNGARVCGGFAGMLCPDGAFCDWEPNSCGAADQQGICRQIPQACPDVYAPVCGCDNNTYGNSCEAASRGVDVLHTGTCAGAATCSLAMVCAVGEFCDWQDRSCGVNAAVGVCRIRPAVCPDVYMPVCGCDGNTYGNSCEAASRGVDVAFDGACANPMSCADTQACGTGQYCNFEPNSCGVGGATEGTCEVRPQLCPDVVAPVCGCDGNTYGNACEAATNGVDVAYEGTCMGLRLCGGFLGTVCADTEYCNYTPDSCGIADQQGVCQPRPQACNDLVAPVCGCDAQTYSNRCEAAMAGADVAHAGMCASTP